MIYISHRGNINGRIPEMENSPEYIDDTIKQGYHVEIDVRLQGGSLFLGHDKPQYEISKNWIMDRKHNLWIHTKNFEAMSYLINYRHITAFYHEKENHVLVTNTDVFWSHNLNEATAKSVIPLLSMDDINKWERKEVYGICSDYIKTVAERTKKSNAIEE